MSPKILAKIKTVADGFLWGHPEFRYSDASHSRQVFASVITVQGIVDNGGLEYLFEQPLDDDPTYELSASAFAEIGASESHRVLCEAIELFKSGVVGKELNGAIENLNKQLWSDSEHNYELLADYAEKKGLG